MKRLVLYATRRGWRGTTPSSLLRLILLVGLRDRARRISLAREDDHVDLWMHRDDRAERMPEPPVHLAEELADEVRRLTGWRERIADWWDLRRKCQVLSERGGTARLFLDGASAELHYWLLPYRGGTIVELELLAGPGISERAGAILLAHQDMLSEGVAA